VLRGARDHGVEWELFADRPDLPLHLPTAPKLNVHLFECRGYRFHSWEQIALPRRIAKLGVDLLHAPASRLPWWQPVPSIVTLHDTIPWNSTEDGWPRGFYTDRLLPRAFRKCAAVITISQHSRRDILARFPHVNEKLHVIPNGVGDDYIEARPGLVSESLAGVGIARPYLLYIGGAIPRKRLDWAIRVFTTVGDPRLTLIMCGVEKEAQAGVLAGVPGDLRRRLRFAPFIAEADMPSLYQNAVAVLYPTLYEGFGLPALEAQAVGTPVLFSDVSSLSELKGPGAVILPPDDLDAWVTTCGRLVAARGESPEPDEPSRAWARQFSWDAFAERTVEVYRSVIEKQQVSPARREVQPVTTH
jgi:glycosyltransferase involved in cell wall biosynthesis